MGSVRLWATITQRVLYLLFNNEEIYMNKDDIILYGMESMELDYKNNIEILKYIQSNAYRKEDSIKTSVVYVYGF